MTCKRHFTLCEFGCSFFLAFTACAPSFESEKKRFRGGQNPVKKEKERVKQMMNKRRSDELQRLAEMYERYCAKNPKEVPEALKIKHMMVCSSPP